MTEVTGFKKMRIRQEAAAQSKRGSLEYQRMMEVTTVQKYDETKRTAT
jgi:hypothetical protein